MSEQRAQQEPSMEEILASIRRIISEDAPPEENAEETPVEGRERPAPELVEDAPRTPEPSDVAASEEAGGADMEESAFGPTADEMEAPAAAATASVAEPEDAEDIMELTQVVESDGTVISVDEYRARHANSDLHVAQPPEPTSEAEEPPASAAAESDLMPPEAESDGVAEALAAAEQMDATADERGDEADDPFAPMGEFGTETAGEEEPAGDEVDLDAVAAAEPEPEAATGPESEPEYESEPEADMEYEPEPAPEPRHEAEPAAEAEEHVAEADEALAAASEPEAEAEPVAASAAEPEFEAEGDPEAEPDEAVSATALEPAGTLDRDELVSQAAEAAATSAFAQLADTVERRRAAEAYLAVGESNKTIEQMVREALKPMLRDWLDQNLPSLVERLIKQEIQRLAERAERRDSE